jgi:uncharacterized membrane protein
MRNNGERGNTALIVIGIILLLGGIAALLMVQMDMVNSAEEGTANTIGGVGCGVGLLALIAGFNMRKKSAG